MNARIILALVRKDIQLFFKDRFFAFITVFGLLVYIAIFFLLPNSVDETLELAIYAPDLPEELFTELASEGLVWHQYDYEEDIRLAIQAGNEQVGLVFPGDTMKKIATGEKVAARLYFAAALPVEFQQAYTLLIEELGFMLAGKPLNLEVEEKIIGPDRAGQQVTPRRRMLPMLAIFILMTETLGLASLITNEIESGTLRALLVTPLRVGGLFLSKGITGVSLAFGQVVLLLAVTGGLIEQPLLVLVTVLLGGLLVAAIGFLISSVARDIMSVMGWGILGMVLLAIPAFNVLIPGLVSNWIKVLPSYYLVDTIYRVTNLGAGWAEVAQNLWILLAASSLLFALGMYTLSRRLQ
jgi:ABC-2 type transport system permease protein